MDFGPLRRRHTINNWDSWANSKWSSLLGHLDTSLMLHVAALHSQTKQDILWGTFNATVATIIHSFFFFIYIYIYIAACLSSLFLSPPSHHSLQREHYLTLTNHHGNMVIPEQKNVSHSHRHTHICTQTENRTVWTYMGVHMGARTHACTRGQAHTSCKRCSHNSAHWCLLVRHILARTRVTVSVKLFAIL